MAHQVAISHGNDFFGQDGYSVTELASMAKVIDACFTIPDRAQLVRLLADAGTSSRAFSDKEAAELATLLRRTARHPSTKDKIAGRLRLLADAAARAADAQEPWIWTLTA